MKLKIQLYSNYNISLAFIIFALSKCHSSLFFFCFPFFANGDVGNEKAFC